MSSLTRCNLCSLLDIKRAAEVTGRLVLLIPTKEKRMEGYWLPAGIDVYVDLVWKAWMPEIPERCVCNDE